MNPLVYWVWLSLRCGAGSELGTYLLNHFKSPQEIYEADEETLRSVEGIDGNILEALLDRDLTYSTQIVEYCERVNVGIMTMHSPIYPERLRSIHAKPIVLYYRGKIPDIDDNVLIACVGMRKCSELGKQTAYQLGKDLAHAGAIVVSGMALGIDAATMKGAIDAGGHTIAVLGCGIDRAYPPENKDLMETIAKTGTVITEFAPGTFRHYGICSRHRTARQTFSDSQPYPFGTLSRYGRCGSRSRKRFSDHRKKCRPSRSRYLCISRKCR